MDRADVDDLADATRRAEVTWAVNGRRYTTEWMGMSWSLYVGAGTHRELTRKPLGVETGPITERKAVAEIGVFPMGRAVHRLAAAIEGQFID